MKWSVLSRDSDNRTPWIIVREDGVKYPRNILPRNDVITYTHKIDADAQCNNLNEEENPNNIGEPRPEKDSINKDLFSSFYKTFLKFKVKDNILLNSDDKNSLYNIIDDLENTDDFNNFVKNLFKGGED